MMSTLTSYPQDVNSYLQLIHKLSTTGCKLGKNNELICDIGNIAYLYIAASNSGFFITSFSTSKTALRISASALT